MATAYVPNFAPTVQSYVLHNATPERIVLTWGGLRMTVPKNDEVGSRAAKDADGKDIPGTLVISDTYTIAADGTAPRKGDPPNWFAQIAIKNLLDIDPDTGQALSPNAKKGISVLPASPTVEMIAAARKAGIERYEQFLVGWATDCVNAYKVANQENIRAGYAPPPPGDDYNRAILILQKNTKKMQEQMGMADELLKDEDEELDEAFEDYARAEVQIRAKRAAEVVPGSDPAALAEALLKNPDVRKKLQKRFRIRQVGHLPDKEGS